MQQAEFNAVYVLETDGFVIDKVTARGNDEYGILAFASDHGLIQRTDAYYNGDSGIYPGSGSDLNADNTSFKATRYAIEIRHNRSHDNTLGYSGTAGQLDPRARQRVLRQRHRHRHRLVVPRPPRAASGPRPLGPQQDLRQQLQLLHEVRRHRRLRQADASERGYIHGTVCPVVPIPVGTGVLIAGGNYDSTDHNWIYDNWRYGTMQFWVPDPAARRVRPDQAVRHLQPQPHLRQPDGPHARPARSSTTAWTSGGTTRATATAGRTTGPRAATPTDNFTVHPPSCADGGSAFVAGCSGEGRGLPVLQPVRPQRPEPGSTRAAATGSTAPSKPTDDSASGALELSSGATTTPADPTLGGVNLLTFGLGALVLSGLVVGRRRTSTRGR